MEQRLVICQVLKANQTRKLKIKERIHLKGLQPLQDPLKKINYIENGYVENGNDTKQYKIDTKK
jgi:hypothetical protein